MVGVPATGGGLAEVVTGRAPVFSWVLSSSGTVGTGAVRIQVGRDSATVTAGSPDVWDAGVEAYTTTFTVTYAGPALQAGTTYYWHLMYVDAAGTSSGWSPTGRFLALGSAVPIAEGDDLIVDWNNPFNPLAGDVTKLRYVVREIPKSVTLRIYSITGGLVKTLEAERDAAPNAVQSVVWDGRNDEGEIVASGIYFAHMTTIPEGTTITKKIVVVK
ncbi:MAG: FlgD immunoglobulin-like domain containing protein [bacterium]